MSSRALAEVLVNQIVDAGADQLCAGGANSRNGYRERRLETCVGAITMRIPKLRTCSFFPDDIVERYQRVARALVAAAAEMYAADANTRKIGRVAETFPSVESLERLVGAVMCDEEWLRARCLSEAKMTELHTDGAAAAEPRYDEELRLVAKRAIMSSLELVDMLETA